MSTELQYLFKYHCMLLHNVSLCNYPESPGCRPPAGVRVVVQSLPGARHLLTVTPELPFPAQQHFCLQPAGRSYVPAQPPVAVSHLTLCHRHRDAVAHSFQEICKKKRQHCCAVKSFVTELYITLKLASGYLTKICKYSFTFLVFERAEFSP